MIQQQNAACLKINHLHLGIHNFFSEKYAIYAAFPNLLWNICNDNFGVASVVQFFIFLWICYFQFGSYAEYIFI